MYARYFSKIMKLSLTYNEGNHLPHHNNADYKDYPIDETYGDSKATGTFYAPFDCKVVHKQIATTNGICFTSLEPVDTPIGKDYVTFKVVHISLDIMNKIQIDQVFKQGDPICNEYKDSSSTGYHNHVTFGLGKLKNSWLKNNRNVGVIQTTNGTYPPEKILYVDPNFTTIKDSRGLTFQNIPSVKLDTPEVYPYTITLTKGTLLYNKNGIKYKNACSKNRDVIVQGKYNGMLEIYGESFTPHVVYIYENEINSASNKYPYEYIIQKGDSLSKIAKKVYGSGDKNHYTYLAKKNNLNVDDVIYPNQKLMIYEYGS